MQINSANQTDLGLPIRQTTEKTDTVKEKVSIDLPKLETKSETKVSEPKKTENPSEVSVNFSLDDRTKQIVVKMLDGKTKEVIRQIPTEVSLKMAEVYQKLQSKFSSKKSDEQVLFEQEV